MSVDNKETLKLKNMSPIEMLTKAHKDPASKPSIIALKFPVSDYTVRLLESYFILTITFPFPISSRIEWKFYPMSEKLPETPILGKRDWGAICNVNGYYEDPIGECLKELKICQEIFDGGSFDCFSLDFSQVGKLEEMSRINSEFEKVMLTMKNSEEHYLGDVMRKLKIKKELTMISFNGKTHFASEDQKEMEEEVEVSLSSSLQEVSLSSEVEECTDPFSTISSISSVGLNAFLKTWIRSSDPLKRSFSLLTGDHLDKAQVLNELETQPFDEEIDYYMFHYTPTPTNAVKITRKDGVTATVVVNNVTDREHYFYFFVDGYHEKQ